MKYQKIGLALGGGGSKGLAHIGIIKVLEAFGIPIDCIAGSSIGALVGGLYAAKQNIHEVEEMALKNNWPQVIPKLFDPIKRFKPDREDKMISFINDYLGKIDFTNLKIPFSAVVTDLGNAQTVGLSSGDVATAIRASISLPLIFKPVEINHKLYVDGGMSMPIPTKIVREMGADFVIAVNLNDDYAGITNVKEIGLTNLINKSVDILTHHLAKQNLADANFVVSPNVGKAGLFDKFLTAEGSREVIWIGESTMLEEIAKLCRILEVKFEPEKQISIDFGPAWKKIKQWLGITP